MKALSTLTVFFTVALCFVFFTGAAFVAAPAAPTAGDDGKEAYENNCAECHGVSVAQIRATTKDSRLKGPDLTDIGEKYQARWIKRYVKKETSNSGKSHKKEFKGTDEELQALVDWLLEQKSE